MQFTAAQISKIVNGKIEGNADSTVTSMGKIEDAAEDQITFLGNPKYEDFLYSTRASIVLIQDTYELKQSINSTIIRVADPYAAFVNLLIAYKEMMNNLKTGIQQPSYISSSASLAENVFIGAFCYLGENVKIGNNTKIYPNTYIGDNVIIGENCLINAGVKIYEECILQNNIIIHSGTVIGSDGFGYAPQQDGSVKKIPQIGNVIIEDNVEVGANTAIDRATMGSTIIKKGVKLDNLIQIAHNVEIGENSLIAALVGVAGSTKLGKSVMVGGQAGFSEHLQVADGVKVGGKAGVTRSIKTENASVFDCPAFDYATFLRCHVLFRNLPEIEKRITEIEKSNKNVPDV